MFGDQASCRPDDRPLRLKGSTASKPQSIGVVLDALPNAVANARGRVGLQCGVIFNERLCRFESAATVGRQSRLSEELMLDSDELHHQAAEIHSALVASTEPIAVTVRRAYAREAAVKLRCGFFRKPLLAGSAAWVGRMVVDDVNAFAFLAGHIELEMAYKGQLYRWTGHGTKISPNEDLPPQMREFMLSKLGPFYVRIQLGTKAGPFRHLLEGLDD
jgi:hypothetical protein